MYLDTDHVVCPASYRTAALIGFLDSLGSGWVLPPASVVAPPEVAKEVDGMFAMEVFRNNLGLETIYKEIQEAVARTSKRQVAQ